MNKKIFKAIIISICSIFILTIIATLVVLYSDYKIGANAAENKFRNLLTQTENAIAKTGIPDEEFIKEFSRAIGSTDYYYSIILKSGSQEIYQFQNKSNLFTITKSSRITEGSTIDLTLTVMIYALPSSLIYSRLRITFIFTLIATLASIACLIYLYTHNEKEFSSEKKSSNDFPNEELDEQFDEQKGEIEKTRHSDEYNFSNSPLDTQDIPIETKPEKQKYSFYDDTFDEPEISKPQSVFIPEFEEDGLEINEEIPEDEISETEIEIIEDEIPDEQILETTENKKEDEPSLFSTTTGFCNENYLVPRLESELSRASSSELDLSLILIQISKINFKEKYGADIVTQILNIFHYRDVIFEYKQDGIAIIDSGADIDKAMEVAETIYTELCSVLATNSINVKPAIGIASRTLRFISGERLIVEAEQALLHAKRDPENPIIAFRVNPEKYRKFMANKI